MDLGHVHFTSASFTAVCSSPYSLFPILLLRLSGRQACKLFLLNRCGHKRTCCLPQPYQLLPLASASSLLGPILVRYLLWLWLWWRAFGNCSLGPAASVLPIVRGLCKIVIGSQLVAAVVGQLSRSGRHANVAAVAAAVVTVV